MSFPAGFLDSSTAELRAAAALQRRELMDAETVEDDFDFALELQLQEAINASLALQQLPAAAVGDVPRPSAVREEKRYVDVLSDELRRLEQELEDKAISETVFKELRSDLNRRIHDYNVAVEISKIPDAEWKNWGNNFARPLGEGTSQGSSSNETFRIYSKGLVETETQNRVPVGGIGIGICDSGDRLLFEKRMPLKCHGTSRQYLELRALIEALNVAMELELKRVMFYCDYFPVFQYVSIPLTRKVPWHEGMNCREYARRNPFPLPEEAKLKSLAHRNMWRQCVQCKHMIELETGCYHMTCRCGHQFCYTCGAEWKNNKSTCGCPLWDDNLIMEQDFADDDDDDDDDDDGFYVL